MTITRERFLSDAAQSCLEIEAHPDTGEVWIRAINEHRQKGVTFRCSGNMAMEIGSTVIDAAWQIRDAVVEADRSDDE